MVATLEALGMKMLSGFSVELLRDHVVVERKEVVHGQDLFIPCQEQSVQPEKYAEAKHARRFFRTVLLDVPGDQPPCLLGGFEQKHRHLDGESRWEEAGEGELVQMPGGEP